MINYKTKIINVVMQSEIEEKTKTLAVMKMNLQSAREELKNLPAENTSEIEQLTKRVAESSRHNTNQDAKAFQAWMVCVTIMSIVESTLEDKSAGATRRSSSSA